MRKNWKKSQKCIKNAKNEPKTAKKWPNLKKQKYVIIFLARNYLQNWYSELKQLKMDLNALKCIQIHIRQKGPEIPTNVKQCQKMSENYK